MRFLNAMLLGAALTTSLAMPALAGGGAEGIWARTDGKAKVQFADCGGALCGTVVWLRDTNGPGQVGEQVFFNMRPTAANHWSGSAHNPEDGRDYDGTMVLSGNRLTTQGCALGGMICKTVYWSRSR
jgi:uncharacterized protein (DUF2147 family)